MTEHDPQLDLDAAVSRLEDTLLALPVDRALPDLDVLLDRAGIPAALLRRDDRVLKVLHEAVLARPFADHELVARTRAEVELLTLEVEVVTDRLGDPTTSAEDLARAVARLTEVRARLEELQRSL